MTSSLPCSSVQCFHEPVMNCHFMVRFIHVICWCIVLCLIALLYSITCCPMYIFIVAKFMFRSPRESAMYDSWFNHTWFYHCNIKGQYNVCVAAAKGESMVLCHIWMIFHYLHYVNLLKALLCFYLILRCACWIAVSKCSISYRCCWLTVYIF